MAAPTGRMENPRVERLITELKEKDSMLETLQTALKLNTARADEAEKDKQLAIMQGLLDETKVGGADGGGGGRGGGGNSSALSMDPFAKKGPGK
eukprot:gene9141-33793_t